MSVAPAAKSADSPKVSATPHGREPGLDVLRFVAVTLVFLVHHQPPDASYGWWHDLFIVLARGGWVGVDLFFVLSGFLVSGLMFREWQRRKQVSVMRFLVRRGLKIYPAYWGLMIFTWIHAAIYGLPGDFRFRYFLGDLLFLQNYLGSMWAHTWSLAVEEHFYLFLAFCVALAMKKKAASRSDPFQFIPALFVWMACACLLLRIATALAFPQYRGRLAFGATHIRMDSLMCGVMVSYLWHFHLFSRGHALLHRIRYALIGAGTLLLTPAFWYDHHDHRWISVYGYSMFYLGGACLLVGSLKACEGRHSPLLRGVTYLGSHSYSVYLWHVLALYWADLLVRKLANPAQFGLISTPLAFCFMWVLGILAAKAVEFPVLRLRDRLFPPAARAI